MTWLQDIAEEDRERYERLVLYSGLSALKDYFCEKEWKADEAEAFMKRHSIIDAMQYVSKDISTEDLIRLEKEIEISKARSIQQRRSETQEKARRVRAIDKISIAVLWIVIILNLGAFLFRFI